MKQLLITIAALVLVGCGESQPTEPPTVAPEILIHEAARDGNIEAVKQHLAAGTDVNAKGKYEETPLLYATLEGHKEIVELLIAKGADVNAKGKGETTPLHYAVIKGNKEVVELLITKGADVNAKFHDGTTPLDWAIGQKKPISPHSSANTAVKPKHQTSTFIQLHSIETLKPLNSTWLLVQM